MSLIKFNKIKTRRTAACLAAGMMIMSAGALFTGCGDNSSNSAVVDQEEIMKSLAYKVEEVKIDHDFYGNIISHNGMYYFSESIGTKQGDYYLQETNIIGIDSAGNTVLTIPVFKQTDPDKYGGISGDIMVDPDGNILCCVYESGYDEATDTYSETMELVKYDSEGNEISRIDGDTLKNASEGDENSYLSDIIIDKNGNFILNMSSYIQVCDSQGNPLFKTDKITSDNGWINGLFITNAGVPAISMYEYTETESVFKIIEIDVAAKGFGKEYVVKNGDMMFDGSGDYLCYFSSSSGISGINAETLESEVVLNLLDLGVDSSNVSAFAVNEDGSFTVVSNDYSTMENQITLSHIKPVETSEVKERKAISLGCFYVDWNVRSDIADFNKTNEEYVIHCTAYSDNNDTSNYEAALTNFHNELLSGNVPDILILNGGMPYDSYASKGMFTDIYELIEKDDELSKDDFLPNVLEAIEKDGKLYRIPTSFYLQSYAGKASVLGDSGNLTVAKADELAASLSEGAAIFSNDSEIAAGNLLNTAINFGSFVDYKNATCNFDSDSFKSVLEFAKRYPAEIDYDKLYNDNPDYWMEQETAIRDNRALLTSVYFSDFSEYRRLKYAIVGEDVAFTLLPGTASADNSSSSIIGLNTTFAISDKSKYKEGAWEFIKTVLKNTVIEEPESIYDSTKGEYVQTGNTVYANNDYGIPVLQSQLEKLAKQAMVPNSYIDENGNKVEEEWTYWLGNEEIKLPTPTEADINECMECIKSANCLSSYDSKLMEIINEEAAYYFNGTKSLDETASMIQSRASMYMSEQY